MRMPRISRPSHGTVVAYTALVLALSGTAYAANGGNFILGASNTATQVSALHNTGTGSALLLTTALTTTPPMVVNGTGKVVRLNADLLDGKDSTAFTVGAFTPLVMTNGWATNCFGGGAAGVAREGNQVIMHGTICNGANGSSPFTLPSGFRPSSEVWLTVDQCNAATGRIQIQAGTGATFVISDPADSGAATCFVSLAGVSYTLPY
jgi:hypothetical protein